MRSIIAASLFRRLAAGLYDLFLIFALCLFATGLALLLNQGQSFGKNNLLFTLYLISVVGLFYCWCWVHGGQTLGMKVWKIQIVQANHMGLALPLIWPIALKRFLCSFISVGCCCGIGYLFSFFNQDKLSLHDYLSKTTVIRI